MEKQSLEALGYKQELDRVLGLPGVIFFGLAFMSPMAIFTYYGLVQSSTHGMIAFSFLIATIAMTFTALSYRRMVQAYPIAGSVYNYVSRSIHPGLGFISGWGILLDYILMPMLNYIIAASYLSILIPGLPTWLSVLVLIIGCTVVNIFGVKIMSMFDNVMVIAMLILVLTAIICAIRAILSNGASLVDGSGFVNAAEWENIGMGGVIAGGAVLCLAFLGFDSVTTLAEETKNPEKTIGKALVILCIVVGITYTLGTYLFQLADPDGWDGIDPDNGAFSLMVHIAGNFMGTALSVMMVIACIASGLSSQASCARLLYGMGRDGQIPKKFFGHVSEKSQVPVYNILLIGVMSTPAMFFGLSFAGSIINFGALLGFTFVNLSVIAHYWVKGKESGNRNALKDVVLPLIGACITFYLWLTLGLMAMIIGFSWLLVGVIIFVVNKGNIKMSNME